MQRNTVVVGIILALLMVSAATVIMSEDTDAVTAPKVIYTEDDIAGTLVIEVDDTSNAPYRVALRGDGLQNKYYYSLRRIWHCPLVFHTQVRRNEDILVLSKFITD